MNNDKFDSLSINEFWSLIENDINNHFNEYKEIRHYLHKYPEISNKEYQTTEYIINYFKKLSHFYIDRPLKTGIVASIGCGDEAFILRSDIDALPIQETTNLSYSSMNEGVMHACGHDMHMSILLGVASVLNRMFEIKEYQSFFNRTIKLIFQPAEETTGGAKRLVEKGVLDNPKTNAVLGLHVDPTLEVGKIALKKGPFYSNASGFDIDIKGLSAHAGKPSDGIDAILASSELIIRLKKLTRVDHDNTRIIAIGKINGGTIRNITADYVHLEGTIRTLKDDVYLELIKKINKIIKDIIVKYHVTININYIGGYITLVNDDELTDYVIEKSRKLLGRENVIILDDALLISEDFAYYASHTKATFYNIGTKLSNLDECILHSSNLLINDDTLLVGIKLQLWLLLNLMIR